MEGERPDRRKEKNGEEKVQRKEGEEMGDGAFCLLLNGE